MGITLQEMMKAVEKLTPAELDSLQHHIDQQRRRYASSIRTPHTPDVGSSGLMAEIEALIAAAPPPRITPPRLPVSGLGEALQKMWEGLSDEAVQAIVAAMNEEYIEPDEAVDV